MSFRRDQSLGYLVNFLARLFARRLDRRLEALGAQVGQFATLLVLWERDGLTQTELAQLVAVEQPTMANTLARMERDGLIRREVDPADRRRSLIYLTDPARALEGPMTAAATEVLADAAEGLSPAEVETARRLITRMIANLQRA
ncbi:MAG: MarR family transcriptional regulator [Alphaproteobacteria bacterium]|jgi:DNA-binding MarR family transcriptional regulator|nr:MarR family transcriptional regulator [Alphaproteobacteria bacterium]